MYIEPATFSDVVHLIEEVLQDHYGQDPAPLRRAAPSGGMHAIEQPGRDASRWVRFDFLPQVQLPAKLPGIPQVAVLDKP
jgi:hypothetical protein